MNKYHHLSQVQRYQIAALLKAGLSKIAIAEQIGVHRSTIGRELKRNSIQGAQPPDKYKADNAQLFANHRASYKPWNRKKKNPAIVRRLKWLLKRDWSPEQIAQTCAQRGIEMLSVEGIYQWIYAQDRNIYDWTNHLRRRHRKRRKRHNSKQPRTIVKNKKSIHDRPQEVNEQQRFGDFETDLMKCTNGYLLTITERKSLFNFIVKIPNKEAETIKNTLIAILEPHKNKIKTITSDNGTEFVKHEAIANQLGIDWYFADPYSSQQRGCNENQNGLIRQYLTRKTNLDALQQTDINIIQNKLNNRPRKKNNFLSPVKLLSSYNVALVV